MSLLMQALKKAEQAKQKQSASAHGDAFAHNPAPTVSPSEREFPTLDPIEPPVIDPVLPEPRAPVTNETRIEPQLNLTEPEQEVDAGLMALEILPAIASVPTPTHIEAALPAADTFVTMAPPLERTPDSANATTTPSKPPDNERLSAPRNYGTEKQAALAAENETNHARKKAKTVFSAKWPARSNRIIPIAVGGMIITAICLGAGFYYWQTTMQNVNVVRNGDRPVRSSQTRAGTVVSSPAPGLEPATAASTMTLPDSLRREHSDKNVIALTAMPTPDSQIATGTRARASKEQKEQAAQIQAIDDIQIHKNVTPPTTNATLTQAYQLFSSGEISAARPLYERVLHEEPNNRDALLGLAAIALNQKQATQAGAFYSRLLDLDPTDPDAIAGLTSLRRGNPEQGESRLKNVLAQNPQSGASLFELGNLYAQQSRWADAQQMYFRAFGIVPANADYAFNLAVSLDHLSQGKLALEYYQRALMLAQQASSNFDRKIAEMRISQLQQVAKVDQ